LWGAWCVKACSRWRLGRKDAELGLGIENKARWLASDKACRERGGAFVDAPHVSVAVTCESKITLIWCYIVLSIPLTFDSVSLALLSAVLVSEDAAVVPGIAGLVDAFFDLGAGKTR
jgi:hypothetical protein